MAKLKADQAALLTARASLQCHGAIGYTTEYDLHLYMKRAWALARSMGDDRVNRRTGRRGDPLAWLVYERGLHHRRRAHARRQAQRRARPRPPRRPRRPLHPRALRPRRRRSRRGRRRRLRVRRHHRSPGRRHRADLLARRGHARRGTRHHRRPPVRFVAAGRPLRRAGRDVGDRRPHRRRRRAEHERDPDQRGDARGRAVRVRGPLLRFARLGGALRHPGGLPVPQRGDDRREVGHHPRRHGGVRGRVARARAAGPGRGPLRPGDRARSASARTTKVRASRTSTRSDRCRPSSRAAA